ncbi:probable serine/threonine-protein kinase DDB_G0280133, partial [Anopheles cruzii]|uniref:probable serine/threonine-protein kinase DDB_G0280133 n=1 Tax=Anopheles cruzii TaxID=68878 RepID=UPI0022EC669E
MAKPFMPPDPQPEEGGTASGAGPPAGNGGGAGGATHNGGQNENNPAPAGQPGAFSFPPTAAGPGNLPVSAPIPMATGHHHPYQGQATSYQHQRAMGHQQHQQQHQQQQQQHHQHHYPYMQHQSYPGAAYHPMASAVVGGPFVGSAPSQEPHPVLQMTPPASGLATAVQTPQLGPVNGDHLMQVLYEALYRYSLG